MKIVDLRVHSIAIADPPLRSSYGLHAPYALRNVLEIESEDGIVGIAETYGGEKPAQALRDARKQVIGANPYRLLGDLLPMVEGEGGGLERSQTDHVPGENPLDASTRTYAAIETACLDLIGKSVADATAELSALDLQVRVDEGRRPDPKVPAGHVLGQEPTPGSPARRQRSIRVWLSAGAHIARAPNLLGETQRSAEIRLAQDGLFVGSVSEIRSAFYPPDIVVAQDPPASTETSEVRLLVNRGEDRAAYVMPDLIGKRTDDVLEALRRSQLKVPEIRYRPYPGVEPGTVLRQAPAAGYRVTRDTAVSLEVTRSAE